MRRFLNCCALIALAIAVVSCGGSGRLGNSEAVVYLTAEIVEYGPDIDICLLAGTDVTIETLDITSHVPEGQTSSTAQDAVLRRWVVTPYRTDGGTTVSPDWVNDIDVYVPAGGAANLENYRVFPAEYFNQVPLSYLLPENGGIDLDTGNRNIRQVLRVELFGETNSGRDLSVGFNAAFNFTCSQ